MSAFKNDFVSVLLVDDENNFLEVSRDILVDISSFDVDTALSVDEAFEKLAIKNYDVIVSDFEMPLKNGLDFLRELKEKGIKIPFILFTGKGREEVAIKALNLGVTYYLNKQGSPETVYGEMVHAIFRVTKAVSSENELKRSQEIQRAIVDNAPIGIATTNISGIILSANKMFCRILGYTEEELKNLSFKDFTHSDSLKDSIKAVEELNSGKTSFFRLIKKYVRKDGKTIDGKVTVSAIRDQDNALQLHVVELEDVTELKKSEDALRESEAKYRELINGMSDTAWLIDSKGKFIDVNASASKILGYSKKELLSMGVTDIDDNLSPKNIADLIRDMPTNGVQVFETVHITKDGTQIPVEISSSLVTYQGKHAILSIARNITMRKRSEEELHKLNRALKATSKSNHELLHSTDLIDLAQKVCKIIVQDCGYALAWVGIPEQNAEKTVRVVAYAGCSKEYVDSLNITWDDSERGRGPTGKAIRMGKPQICNELSTDIDFAPWRKQANQIGFTTSAAFPLIYGKEKIGVLNIYSKEPNAFLDNELELLTELANDLSYGIAILKLRAEKEQAERELIESFDEMLEGVQIIDKEWRYVYLNNAAVKHSRKNKNELLGKTMMEAFPGLENTKMFSELQRCMKTRLSIKMENEFVYSDGVKCWFELNIEPAPQGILVLSIDITNRKKAELLIKESEEKYRSLFENSFDGIMLTKPDGSVLAANPKMCRLLGMTEEEVKKAGREGLTIKDEKLLAAIKERSEKRKAIGEITFKRKDGSTFVGEASSHIFQDTENEVKTSVIVRDISERKKVEENLQKTISELTATKEKLCVVGSLVRHDVCNNLSVIENSSFLLRNNIEKNIKLEKYIDNIESAIDAINKLFDFSRIYEKIGVEQNITFNLGECFNLAVEAFNNLSSVQITNKCKGLFVVADSLLRHVFYILIDNSLKHGETVTQISLSSDRTQNQINVIYEDNGVGLPEVNKEKMFTDAYTSNKSTGLGLNLAKKIIETYGWTISLSKEKGKGAKFIIKIPKITSE